MVGIIIWVVSQPEVGPGPAGMWGEESPINEREAGSYFVRLGLFFLGCGWALLLCSGAIVYIDACFSAVLPFSDTTFCSGRRGIGWKGARVAWLRQGAVVFVDAWVGKGTNSLGDEVGEQVTWVYPETCFSAAVEPGSKGDESPFGKTQGTPSTPLRFARLTCLGVILV